MNQNHSLSLRLAGLALLAATGSALALPFNIGGIDYTTTGPSETVRAAFNTPAGGVTVNQYSGLVWLTVSGTGASLGNILGDAFYYNFGSPTHDANHYQLVVTTDGSVAVNNADDAYRQIVYDVNAGTAVSPGYTPAYRADHVYSFVLNLSGQTLVPNFLRFGVNDGSYGDNNGGDGAYTVQIRQLGAAAVPDAGSSAILLGLGVAGLAWFGRRRQAS